MSRNLLSFIFREHGAPKSPVWFAWSGLIHVVGAAILVGLGRICGMFLDLDSKIYAFTVIAGVFFGFFLAVKGFCSLIVGLLLGIIKTRQYKRGDIWSADFVCPEGGVMPVMIGNRLRRAVKRDGWTISLIMACIPLVGIIAARYFPWKDISSKQKVGASVFFIISIVGAIVPLFQQLRVIRMSRPDEIQK